MKQTIQNELSKSIPLDLVKNLLEEYEGIGKAFYTGDNSKLVSTGKFVEIIFSILKFVKDGTLLDYNNINISQIDKELSNLNQNPSGKEELLFLAIPRVAKSIQTIRSKKRVAHIKELDPILQDREFIKSSADWIIASFLFLFHTKSEVEIRDIIEKLVQRDVPFIEEFEDGGILVLKKLPFNQKILVVLYKQNGMIEKKDLKNLIKPKYNSEFDTNLRNLKDKLLIYVNGEKIKITQKGIIEVENNILKN